MKLQYKDTIDAIELKNSYTLIKLQAERPEEAFTDRELVKVTQSDEPSLAFDNLIDSKFRKAESEAREQFVKEILTDDEMKPLVPEHEYDKAAELVRDTIRVKYPREQFLGNTEVLVDLVVENGRWVQEPVIPSDPCAITWLLAQQGYKKSELRKAMKAGKSDDAFLDSLVKEMEAATSNRTLLTFFFRMPMSQYLEFRYVLRNQRRHGILVLKKGTTCGLYDPWNGKGGLMGIRTNHPVLIPFDSIPSAAHDGALSPYSARKVFGCKDDAWKDNDYLSYILLDKPVKMKDVVWKEGML